MRHGHLGHPDPPYSVLVAIVALVAALALKRRKPRLVWPFLFSTVTSAAVFFGLPLASEAGLWVVSLFIAAFWAALGTVTGVVFVKLAKATIRAFKGK